MGGIAGMIRFDGQEIATNDSTNITNLLRHRGKVTSQSIDRGILLAFGGTMEVDSTAGIYATTDVDVFDNVDTCQPFVSNYLRNGSASFNELSADFAVALWDARQQMLVCVRDSIGVKPLYYVHQPNRFFAFATEIKALLSLQEVAVNPNQHKFREYLQWTTTYVPYSAETFYETIYSVLPGHYIQVSAQEVSAHPYWKLDLKKFSNVSGSEAYSTLFNEYFTSAVNARMKGKSNVGAHLSGGLDSSSVSCVAQFLLTRQNRPPLHTFNIDTGLASTDESKYVQAVVDMYHPKHHTVHPVANILDSIIKINHLFDRPEHFIIPSSFHLSVSLEAQQIGFDCILTGHDGDSVITTSFDYLDKLIEESAWENLQAACQQFVSYPERHLSYVSENWLSLSQQTKVEKYVVYIIGSNLTKRFKDQSLSTFFNTLTAQKKFLGISMATIVAYCAKRIRDRMTHQAFMDNAFTTDFKLRVRPKPQLSTQELTTQISLEHHVPVNQILNTTNVLCNEQLNHIGAYHGHHYSFPFFDKHLIELGLATPLNVGFDHGRGRGLIRNGLQAILPPAIIARLTKANFVEYGNRSVQQLYQSTHEHFSVRGHAIWEVIDRTKFSEIVAVVFDPRIPMQRKTRYNWLLSRIIYLALWLGFLPSKKGSMNCESIFLKKIMP